MAKLETPLETPSKTLREIHEDVPPDYYDRGIRNNSFQRAWHWRRFKNIEAMVEPVGGAILDVGCHSGKLTQHIIRKSLAKQVCGVDISPGAIYYAAARIPSGHFVVGDAHYLPYSSQSFDAIFCMEALEHVDNPRQALREIARCLRPGGYVIVLVPTDNFLFRIIWSLWTFRNPVWRHAHVQSFNGRGLDQLIKETGFRIVEDRYFLLRMLRAVKLKFAERETGPTLSPHS